MKGRESELQGDFKSGVVVTRDTETASAMEFGAGGRDLVKRAVLMCWAMLGVLDLCHKAMDEVIEGKGPPRKPGGAYRSRSSTSEEPRCASLDYRPGHDSVILSPG